MPSTIFSGSKVKALKSTLNLNGGADIISSTTDPTSVAVDAAIGSLLLNTTSGKLYRKNDSGSSTNWSEVGSGIGGINYILNPSAETNTTGWTTYKESDSVTFQDTGDTVTLNNHGLQNGTAISFTVITSTTGISVNTRYYVVSATTNTFQVADTVGGAAKALTTNGSGTLVRSLPKTATGGTANVTWTRSTSTPLRGAADFRLTKGAANYMGEGVEYDFVISDADKAKPLSITFDYQLVATSTYADGDVTLWIYDVDASTLIQPAGYTVLSATDGMSMRQVATFQTSASSTNYRLILHVSTVSASAYTLAIDNVVVGPQTVQYGAPVTEPQSFTPTFSAGFGTTSNVSFKWQRIGDKCVVRGTAQAGTIAASEANFTTPYNWVIDVNKTIGPTISAATRGIVGRWTRNSGTASASKWGYLLFAGNSESTVRLVGEDYTTTLNPYSPPNATTLLSNSDLIGFEFEFYPVGWSSNVQMSSDTDTRVIAFKGYATGNTSVPTGAETAITFAGTGANLLDTAGGWNGTNTYTVPVSGNYRVSVTYLSFAANATGVRYAIVAVSGATPNRNFLNRNDAPSGTQITYLSGSTIVPCVAGDTIQIRAFQSSGVALNVGADANVSIERLSGPAVVAASEKIYASYTVNTSQSIPDQTPTAVNFSNKINDSHSAVTVGASWKFIAPRSDWYLVNTYVIFSTTTNFVSGAIFLYKNGIQFRELDAANGVAAQYLQGGISIYLLAGEYITIAALQDDSTGAARNIYDGVNGYTYPFIQIASQ